MKPIRMTVGEELGWGPGGIGQDMMRHQEKVRDAIRNNLADIVLDERIGMTDGSKVVQVPLTTFREYRIAFDHDQGENVGHNGQQQGGRGTGSPGDAQPGKQGGSEPGIDVEEMSLSLESIEEVIFEQLSLPHLDLTRKALGESKERPEPETLTQTGPRSQWHRRATLRAHLRRRAGQGHPGLGALMPEDLRYWRYQPTLNPEGGAVVLAMMDTSGSMGNFEKYLAKSFFYWTVAFLRKNYPHVELVFLAHDVRAREVDEETFFHRGASGGTVSSSVYRLGLDVLNQRFRPEQYNAYAFHFTDGGNLTSDNGFAEECGNRLKERTNFFGYGEIHDTERSPSPLYQAFAQNDTHVIVLRSKEDIFRALMKFFGPDTWEDSHAAHL